ncbi:DNA methylase [Streptomyces tendae]|uniref:DNA methyltransferase n=1 Tax=Streptomyces tendae TaxID=1932 RepID=UPI001674547C|nr:DNA methyltransferase [Streptomyces tendae]GHA59019.1 DNA methylase [Streptomyces tendae]
MTIFEQESMFGANHEGPAQISRTAVPRVTALEAAFPAGLVSAAAERESWRKEVHRPATHTHKWWAQRLGSVFRGILAAAVAEDEPNAIRCYSNALRLDGLVVCDPFAGSGTTLAEAAKLGAKVIGRDINPVATLVQRQALASWDLAHLESAYKQVEARVRRDIDEVHRDKHGRTVLYYFWVALAHCPQCPTSSPPVELFSRYVFAQHAYPKKYPNSKATCPRCHAVEIVNVLTDQQIECGTCGQVSSLTGPVNRATMTCHQGHVSKVLDSLGDQPPKMRMYAKQVLADDGSRRYEPIDEFDIALYERTEKLLAEQGSNLVLPAGALDDGYNTRQAIRWNYREWKQFFNARQLYSMGLLGSAIRDLDPSPEREALAALFSGVLEFNNLFCSFKGEGTGAVRHMFSNHVLKPERTPLEAHPWGTPQSSGAFSTLYQSRILRAWEYKQKPHDLVPVDGKPERVFGLSMPLSLRLGNAEDLEQQRSSAYVRFGSSASFDLAEESVELVITDPPFMDNVHYSELADFFHAWLRQVRPFEEYPTAVGTTRNPEEVQSADPGDFGRAIAAVWKECARILKPSGLLAFTFHQARIAGWIELVRALEAAGLVITAVQPVKAEMSTSTTKSSAANPSNLDSIVVCRLADQIPESLPTTAGAVSARAIAALRECQEAGITVGYADVESVIRGSVLALHTRPGSASSLEELSLDAEREVVKAAAELDIEAKKSSRQTNLS